MFEREQEVVKSISFFVTLRSLRDIALYVIKLNISALCLSIQITTADFLFLYIARSAPLCHLTLNWLLVSWLLCHCRHFTITCYIGSRYNGTRPYVWERTGGRQIHQFLRNPTFSQRYSTVCHKVEHLVTCFLVAVSFFFHLHLTHWGREKMDAISQTTFSSAFSWMKMFEFRLKFHWSLFLGVQLIFQH